MLMQPMSCVAACQTAGMELPSWQIASACGLSELVSECAMY